MHTSSESNIMYSLIKDSSSVSNASELLDYLHFIDCCEAVLNSCKTAEGPYQMYVLFSRKRDSVSAIHGRFVHGISYRK